MKHFRSTANACKMALTHVKCVCVCVCRQMYLYLQYNLKANKPHNQTRRNYWQITKSTNRRTINQHQQIKMSAGIKQHLLFTIRLNNDEWITQLSWVEQSWAEPRLQPAQQQQQQPTSSSRKESTRKLLATDWVRQMVRMREKGNRGRGRVFPATFRDYVQITTMAVASLNCLLFEYGLVFVSLFEFRLFSFDSFGLRLNLNEFYRELLSAHYSKPSAQFSITQPQGERTSW